MISLRNRLSVTYALFMSAALVLLTFVINKSAETTFQTLAKNNIAYRSAEIERAVRELYNPFTRQFDLDAVEAIGMIFAHEGYITTVRDKNNGAIWDARACDMEECNSVINDITARMEKDYRLTGALKKETYPVLFGTDTVGIIEIETYGPFFYSETEALFLRSLNRLLIAAGSVFITLSIALSVLLATSISRPVRAASVASRMIAEGNFDARMKSDYRTNELHELAASLNGMASVLQEAERRQKQLTADVAHELRTPLTCLQGEIEAMLDSVWEATAERLESCLEETKRLTKLVEDISRLTAIEWQGITLDKTNFDISDLLGTVALSFESALREKNIALQLDTLPCPLFADYDRLKQVFVNLLSNAVKYTDTGSISITAKQQENGQCEIKVADTGIGIAGDELPHIFERFYRTDKSRSRLSGGSGIGLTIAAAIVRSHGGTISAESESGKGSVFTVVLQR